VQVWDTYIVPEVRGHICSALMDERLPMTESRIAVARLVIVSLAELPADGTGVLAAAPIPISAAAAALPSACAGCAAAPQVSVDLYFLLCVCACCSTDTDT
jgi:hypothetical protein